VNISHLSEEEQTCVFEYITENNRKISLDISEELKDTSANGELDEEKIADIFGVGKSDNEKFSAFKLHRNIYKRFFRKKQTNDEVNNTIKVALTEYFERHTSVKKKGKKTEKI
jgi:hypothetical protein